MCILKTQEKQQALQKLIDLLNENTDAVPVEVIREGIVKRENLMSTGIGLGIAVPHVRVPGIKKPFIIVGVSPEGISDYQAIDNQPVHIIVMIIVEQGAHKKYISILSSVVEYLKKPGIREKICETTEVEHLFRLFTEHQS
jgi:mannitol/fructose-specific phosphotransferase system IIA component (Ntr-type)